MSDIKMYDGHGRCYSADQIAQIARFIEGGRPEGLRLYPINGAPGRFLVDAEQFDAQRLRADTAEARVKTAEHDLEFFKAGKNEQFDRAEAAEQRIAKLETVLRSAVEWFDDGVGRSIDEFRMIQEMRAALNQKSEGESHGS